MHSLLYAHLSETCPTIHASRLQAVMDVALSLQKSQSLALTQMGRYIDSQSDIKHRIKKVDRLESNKHLHEELFQIYSGISDYLFTYVKHNGVPIVIDLCYIKDNKDIQMLSAEYASKGRSQPLYREVFKSDELKDRAGHFIKKLADIIPSDKTVICIMDAAFCEDWFNAIESHNWYWIARVRKPKSIKLNGDTEWTNLRDFIPTVGPKTKNYENVMLYRHHSHPCRIVTTRKSVSKKRAKTKKYKNKRLAGNGRYLSSAQEPWILATNLPSEYKSVMIVNLYGKRMQIEESFRDIKSPQFGLAGRTIRATCIHRWGVKMLLAAIVQMISWILGIIGHSKGFQRMFQANTVRDKKVFSNFTLGKLIIEFDKLKELNIEYQEIPKILEQELSAA